MYIQIAEALERLDPPEGLSPDPQEAAVRPCQTVTEILEVAERAYSPSARATKEEQTMATQLVRGHNVVEVLGHGNKGRDSAPDPIVLPEPRALADYVSAPCKHECSLLRQSRVVKHAFKVHSSLGPVKQSLMLASAGQGGRDNAHC